MVPFQSSYNQIKATNSTCTWFFQLRGDKLHPVRPELGQDVRICFQDGLDHRRGQEMDETSLGQVNVDLENSRHRWQQDINETSTWFKNKIFEHLSSAIIESYNNSFGNKTRFPTRFLGKLIQNQSKIFPSSPCHSLSSIWFFSFSFPCSVASNDWSSTAK